MVQLSITQLQHHYLWRTNFPLFINYGIRQIKTVKRVSYFVTTHTIKLCGEIIK